MKGKPLISAEVETGTSFVNLDSETGIVVPPENAQLLAEAMNRLAADPVEAKRLGKNARARFESVFTSKQMADAYLEEYEQLLG
jgi:rhamnosyl/mannosyltransferase